MTRIKMLLTLGLAGMGAAACVEDIAAPPPPPKESELVHYWNFNTLPEGTLTSAAADFSKLTGAVITYPGTGLGYMDRVDPGTDLNAREGAVAGFGIRPRNPANTREFIIVAPSTGYEKVVVTFAVMRSSNGAVQEEFSYSTDGGTTWVLVGVAYNIEETYNLKTFDLSTVSAVNDNPNLRFRIKFVGTNSDGASGNNRIDNIAVDGVPLT